MYLNVLDYKDFFFNDVEGRDESEAHGYQSTPFKIVNFRNLRLIFSLETILRSLITSRIKIKTLVRIWLK